MQKGPEIYSKCWGRTLEVTVEMRGVICLEMCTKSSNSEQVVAIDTTEDFLRMSWRAA